MELPSFCINFLRNFLTGAPANRALAQKLAISSAKSLAYLAGASFLYLTSMTSSAQGYSTLALKQDVAKFLATHYAQEQHERLDIKVGNLDNRLRLEPCPESIIFNLQDPTGLGGSVSIQARCPGPEGWAVHVPAQVLIYRHIPVAARTIARGEYLNETHLTNNLINVSSIRQGYALSPEHILGKEAKRNIGQGEPFKTSSLDAPTAIKRGETVTLQAKAGGIKVMSSGIALADGRVGQKIRVRNSSSERIVTGVVLNQGLVQTL
jgi:flagella basal body P-ring formation protein FlgA